MRPANKTPGAGGRTGAGDATALAPDILSHPAAGTKTVAKHLGDAVRHVQHAAALNLRHGPSAQVAASVRLAGEALNSALFVCDYAEGER